MLIHVDSLLLSSPACAACGDCSVRELRVAASIVLRDPSVVKLAGMEAAAVLLVLDGMSLCGGRRSRLLMEEPRDSLRLAGLPSKEKDSCSLFVFFGQSAW